MLPSLLIFTLLIAINVLYHKLRKSRHKLQETERSKTILLAHLPGMAYQCQYDEHWTMTFVSKGCQDLTGYPPADLLYNKRLSFNDLICPKYRPMVRKEWERILRARARFRAEYQITTIGQEQKWVLEVGQGIYDAQGRVEALEGLIIDITEDKLREQRIQYMQDHDLLTGLHNRNYFERAKRRLAKEPASFPLSLIVADINGLKLINGAFGHPAGDQLLLETAQIILANCRPQDIAARIGGSKFKLLLPQATEETAKKISEQILNSCLARNENSSRPYTLSLSLAQATVENQKTKLQQGEKEAEESLHERKLLDRAATHKTMLSTIMAALYARSQETEEHARRLAQLSIMIGKELNLPSKSLAQLELLAMLHDIGKIGIDDRVLNKPGKLDEQEWALMKKHPEIGSAIAMSSSELETIAPYILTHHERWDGTGYPQGLQGEEIPLLSRILAVADAFDAMTEDRIYRKALDRQAALAEIEENAGSQFDPFIARIFLKNMRRGDWPRDF